MSLKPGNTVRVYTSSGMTDTCPSRPATILDLKWNLAQVRYDDGEREVDWVDCRYIRKEEGAW